LSEDRNWLIAGFLGAVTVPGLTFGAGLPFVVSAGIGVAVFAGLLFLLAPRRVFEGIDVSAIGRSRLDLARKVLGDALPQVDRLDQVAKEIRKPDVKARVARLAVVARGILAGVEQDANRLAAVQRFLTYYLPQAGEIAARYPVLEQMSRPDAALVTQTEGVIAKLEDAFGHYKDSLLDSDLADLDVELRLIETAIRDDMGKR